MLRILTSIFAFAALFFAVKVFVKSMKAEDLVSRITAFFLLVMAVIVTILAIHDTYTTWRLLIKFHLGQWNLIDPPVYPESAPLYGIWEHPFDCLISLNIMCLMTFLGLIFRKRIPVILSKERDKI